MNLGGRKSKLNEDLITRFCLEIQEGLPINYACDVCEIDSVSYNNWMNQGKYDRDNEVKSLYSKFFSSVKKSYATFIRDCKKTIRNGEPGWQGTAWWLERTNKDFQLNVDKDVTVENIVVNTKMLSRRNK